MKPNDHTSDRWAWLLVGIVAIAAALRVVLVWRGGQLYWSDEQRYLVASNAFGRLQGGDVVGAFRDLFATADHLLFKVISLVPAALQTYLATGNVTPALFFAGFSVLNIYLVWRIAIAAGASSRQAVTAALLLALSNTHFAYARHLLPYDLAMTFGLLALAVTWVGDGWRRSLLGGCLAGLGFLTYNGAWLFGAVVLVGHVLLALPRIRLAALRAGWAAAGLVAPILGIVLIARGLGSDLVSDFLRFAGTVNQGDYGRGWHLLLEYFWAAEGWLLPLALLGMGLVVAGAWIARRKSAGLQWVAGALALLAGLIVLSDVWPAFVVYGRSARMVVPLVCLAGACALEHLWQAGPVLRRVAAVVLLVAVTQAAVNFAQPLGMAFPTDFRNRALQEARRLQLAGEQRQLVIIHAESFLGEQSVFANLPDHDLLMVSPNPLQYLPYQLEGHNERQRANLAGRDIRMKLIAVNRSWFSQPVELRHPYPGVVQMVLRLPQDRTGAREPLLISGSTGSGDLLYLIYDSPHTVRLGFDHWAVSGMESEPVEVDYSQPVTVTLSTGPLHDPAMKPDAELSSTNANLRQWLFAQVNSRVVWSRPAEFHPAAPSSVTYGVNYIGGSTCGPRFGGGIVSLKSLVLPPILAYKNNLSQPYPGTVDLTLRLPLRREGVSEPLVVTGITGAADLVYIRYEGANRIRVGYDHWGIGGCMSDPIAVDASRQVRIRVSLGSLFAPSLAAMPPAQARLRDWLHVEVDGAVVWSRPASFYPTEPKSIVFMVNDIGASTCEPKFTGEILEIESVQPPALP